MSGHFPRGLGNRIIACEAPDIQRGGTTRAPSSLARGIGGIAYLLEYEYARLKPAVYHDVYKSHLPYAPYAVATVVAMLEDEGRAPKIDEVRAKIGEFLGVSRTYAAKVLDVALEEGIVSRYAGDDKDTVFLQERMQRDRVQEVEDRLFDLHMKIHQRLLEMRQSR